MSKSKIGSQSNGIFTYPCKKFRRGFGYGFKYTDPQHRQRKKCGFERRIDAENERSRVLADMSVGKYINPNRGKETIAELGSLWLEGKRNIVKKATYDKYESLWRVHVKPYWGDTSIANVTHSSVQRWVGELSEQMSGKQAVSVYSVLNMIMRFAVKDKRISENPCVDVSLPSCKPVKARRYLSMSELSALARAGRNRKSGDYETLILFLGTTGMRFGEATALRVKNIDFETGLIKVEENAVWSGKGMHVNSAKNGEERIVGFPKRLLAERLRAACAHKDPEALVFERPGSVNDGRHLTIDDYMRRPNKSGWFEATVNDSRLPRLTLHDLRHTAVSLAIHANVSTKVVQQIAGHKTATMTIDYYADLYVDDLKTYGDQLDREAQMVEDASETVPENTHIPERVPNEYHNSSSAEMKKSETLEISDFDELPPLVPPERVELSLSD